MTGFQQAVKFCLVPSRGHLAMFGHIFGCHILIAQLRQNATGIKWVEARMLLNSVGCTGQLHSK